MIATHCVTADELRAFSLGLLPEDRSEEILAHLSACAICEDTVSGFERTSDSLVQSLRAQESAADASNGSAVANASEPRSQAALNQALQQIRTLVSDSRSERPENVASTAERIRDYELLEALGSGGMGTVYRAVHTKLERIVALKLLPARRLRDHPAIARFEREMKAIGRLDHPAIVRATDAGEYEGTHFLAMDYVEGIDLGRLVRLLGPLPVEAACEVVRQAALGLQYAHEQGLIHRDVKPGNLMLTCKGEVRILDLGLALFGAASEAVDELTTVGQLMGTLDYMAPEQCDNSHSVDARADVYSLGATLFKLLTGTAPYEATDHRTPLQKMKALATIDAPSIGSLRDLPEGLVQSVDRMLNREPSERFATAADAAVSLETFSDAGLLPELVAEGVRLAALNRETFVPEQMPASVVMRSPPGTPSAARGEPVGAPEKSGSQRRRRGLLPVLFGPLAVLALLAGVVIWLKTDTGMLLIESSGEGVPIEIRSGQKLVAEETLHVGRNQISIRSGQYEIVLPKGQEELRVENGRIELTRGTTWMARVTKRTDDASQASGAGMSSESTSSRLGVTFSDPLAAVEYDHLRAEYRSALESLAEINRRIADSLVTNGVEHPDTVRNRSRLAAAERQLAELRDRMQILVEKQKARTADAKTAGAGPQKTVVSVSEPEPLFSGRTFEQWQQEVLAERNPDELEKAVRALCLLGRGHRDREAAETVLRIVQPYCGAMTRALSSGDSVGVTGDIRLVMAAVGCLHDLDADVIAPTVIRAFREGNEGMQALIVGWLCSSYPRQSWSLETGNGDPLFRAAHRHPDYVPALIAASKQHPGLKTQIFNELTWHIRGRETDPAVADYFRAAIKDAQPSHAAYAAALLAEVEPSEQLAQFLIAQAGPAPQQGAIQYSSDLRLEPWMGLIQLGPHLKSSSGTLRDILLETPVPYPLGIRSSEEEFSRRIMAVECLAMMGDASEETLRSIQDLVELLTEHRPVLSDQESADFTFEPAQNELLLEELVRDQQSSRRQRFEVPRETPPSGRSPRSKIHEPERLLNSCLSALHRLTGRFPRFTTPVLTLSSQSIRGFSPGGSPIHSLPPRLALYKGRNLADWLARTTSPQETVSELTDLHNAVHVLSMTDAELRRAMHCTEQVLEAALHRDGELTDNEQQLILNCFTTIAARDPAMAVAAIARVFPAASPERQALILREIAAPFQTASAPQFRMIWPAPNVYSRNLIAALRPAAAGEAAPSSTEQSFDRWSSSLINRWSTQPAELRSAVLRFESVLPAQGFANSTGLLLKLLDSKEEHERLDAAFILATIPGQHRDEVMDQRIEKVLVPYMLGPAHQTANQAAIAAGQTDQRSGLVNAAAALALMKQHARPADSEAGLSDETIQSFLATIRRDSTDQKFSSFRVFTARMARSGSGSLRSSDSSSRGSDAVPYESGDSLNAGTDGGRFSSGSRRGFPGRAREPGGSGSMFSSLGGFAFGGLAAVQRVPQLPMNVVPSPLATAPVWEMKSSTTLSRRILLVELLMLIPPRQPAGRMALAKSLQELMTDQLSRQPSPETRLFPGTMTPPLSEVAAGFEAGMRFVLTDDGDANDEQSRFLLTLEHFSMQTATGGSPPAQGVPNSGPQAAPQPAPPESPQPSGTLRPTARQ